jgi:ribose transport system substrate-binding protein
MKRWIGSIGLLVCGLSAGCNREHKKVVAVIPKGSSHLFWQSVHAGAAKAAKETGVDIVWNGPPSETDYSGQLQIVDAMINRHVDAIALAPIDRKVMVSVVERGTSQNIPMIIFDSGVDTDKFVSQVATDNYKAGVIAAQRMGKILAGKGKILMTAVQPGAASTEAREKGFEDTLAKEFPDVHIIDKRFGMAEIAKSLTVTENMLTAHPDVDAIFASNESSSMGAAQALRGRRGHIKLVGFDSSPTLLDDLKSGLIDSLVVQNPFEMGYQSVMMAVKRFKGEPVPKIDDLAPRLVDLSNLNEPDVQAQLHPDLKKWLQ